MQYTVVYPHGVLNVKIVLRVLFSVLTPSATEVRSDCKNVLINQKFYYYPRYLGPGLRSRGLASNPHWVSILPVLGKKTQSYGGSPS